MNKTTKELLTDILEALDNVNHIPVQDFPNIDLYMDQVTTFMDSRLGVLKRYEDDKVLTKTMINNYAKNQLLPAPDKKKYTKEHLLTMVFIYYFKNFLSISDIQKVLSPILDKYFSSKDNVNLSHIYDEIFRLESAQIPEIKADIWKKYDLSVSSFENVQEKDREILQQFALICELSFDIFYKKFLLERMIDHLQIQETPSKAEKKSKQTAE